GGAAQHGRNVMQEHDVSRRDKSKPVKRRYFVARYCLYWSPPWMLPSIGAAARTYDTRESASGRREVRETSTPSCAICKQASTRAAHDPLVRDGPGCGIRRQAGADALRPDIGEGSEAEVRHRRDHLGPEDVQGALDPGVAAGGESPAHQPAN